MGCAGCGAVSSVSSVAGTSLSCAYHAAQLRPAPSPVGWKQRGLPKRGAEPRGKEAERRAVWCAGFTRFVSARRRGGGDTEPRSGRAPCWRILRPSSEGRRLRAQRRVVRRRLASLVREHRGWVQWGGVPRAVLRGGVAQRPRQLGRGGREDGATEALADCVSSGRAAVVSWRGPCDGAGRKETP